MKLRCERDVLTAALATASRAVSSRSGALPVLSGVRMEVAGDRLELTGSDLELTASVTVDVAGLADGVTVVPAKLAADIVKSLPEGAVEFETTEDTARISAGRTEFSLRVFRADEFPRVAAVEGDEIRFKADLLLAAVNQVLSASSSDDKRPILTGVLMAAEGEGLRLVATDSYRLAVRDLPGVSVLSSGRKVLVPARALSELSRALGNAGEITMRLGERDTSFSADGITITTRLIEGDFPNYQNLIPANQPNRLTVSRDALLDALRRVKLLARDTATPVRLEMSADGLELRAVSQEHGEGHESLDASYEGDELTVAFNPEYLLDGIDAAGGDEIVLSSNDGMKPAIVRNPASDEFLYLLMPVRVQ